VIDVEDLGSGGGRMKPSRRVRDVARRSLSSPKFSRLYHRLAAHINAKVIVELGTSLGVNTLYLAQERSAKVSTFEGSGSIARIAQSVFDVAGVSNIQLIEGDIDKTLRNFLSRSAKIDLAFIDANHRYEPTLQYFNWLLPNLHAGSLVIIDDIYHSEEMKKAWIEIKNHKLVYGSADLFQCGLIFFDPSLNKQGVVLQF
jgi:predicted O-methyltransferase YrrM